MSATTRDIKKAVSMRISKMLWRKKPGVEDNNGLIEALRKSIKKNEDFYNAHLMDAMAQEQWIDDREKHYEDLLKVLSPKKVIQRKPDLNDCSECEGTGRCKGEESALYPGSHSCGTCKGRGKVPV